MSTPKAVSLFAALAVCICLGGVAHAKPPADDFLNPQAGGPRLTLMPFIGPGFRANYDHRFVIEEDMSEVRTQLIGDVALPFSEVSANVDVRFFVTSFGASVGYHNEWRLLQFNPDPGTGRDRAGQPGLVDSENPTSALPPSRDPSPGYLDLNRTARAVKDQNADVRTDQWAFYEGRWGFFTPAPHFMGVSTLALRHEARPDVSYDWVNGTVYNGGWHLRWEGYLLLRDAKRGFIGPALRALYVPRNRVEGSPAARTLPGGVIVPEGSACQTSEALNCEEKHEFEFHYGILAGVRPSWVTSSDLLLFRAYATWGFGNDLFGTHTFRQPLQILMAYMVDIDL